MPCGKATNDTNYFNPRSRVGNDDSPLAVPYPVNISIHVPAWGTTFFDERLFFSYIDFNPRSRVGNDQWQNYGYDAVRISIHVPAWGTTWHWSWTTLLISDFNPRSRVGNDGLLRHFDSTSELFQSTFPRGERPDRRFRKGYMASISIHVPAWGTTITFSPMIILYRFQSTFPRGERRWRFIFFAPSVLISIHVPAWGTTANFNNFSLIYSYK